MSFLKTLLRQGEGPCFCDFLNGVYIHGTCIYIYIQVVPGRAGGGSLPIECAQDNRPLRCPNFFLGLNEAFAVAWL